MIIYYYENIVDWLSNRCVNETILCSFFLSQYAVLTLFTVCKIFIGQKWNFCVC